MFADVRDPRARVRALCEFGCRVDVDATVPPRRYLRSGVEMMRNADLYMDDGQLESAFILYSKFVTLFVEKLPKHPDYKTAAKVDIKKNKAELKKAMKLAEAIKEKLLENFTREEEKRQQEEQRAAAERAAAAEAEAARQRLAAEAARAEAARIEAERHERLRLEQEQTLRQLKEEELIRLQRLQEQQQQQQQQQQREQQEASEKAAALAAAAALAGTHIHDAGGSPPPAYGSAVPPPPYTPTPDVPSRSLKPQPQPSMPSVDRSTKPMDHFMSTGVSSNNPYGLKTVVVPAELMVKFLNLALPNTARSIETFGALCGKLVPSRNCYVLSHLVIPKQRGTPDSCEPYDEEEIFSVQDKYGLNFIGWIHTHPTQTAFLSSVDCHTQCSYQLLLPEMLAIVCSPKYNETGFFHLSPDHGLDFVARCTQTGFHKHPDNPPLFQECPHVQVDSGVSVTVIDLR